MKTSGSFNLNRSEIYFSSQQMQNIPKRNLGKSGESKLKEFAKSTALAGGMAVAAAGADLFILKGKGLNTLTQGKVSFIKTMSDEIDNVLKKDGYATKTRLEAFLSFPGLHAVWNHRIIHKLHNWKIPVLPRFLQNISRILTGIEIHPGAKIGKNVFIDHTGAIIGETAKVGNDVTIVGRVVLGSNGKGDYLRHTVVEDGAMLGMNSVMLGRITVGKNAKVGAGAIVTHDVPPNLTVIGNPARIISTKENRIIPALSLKNFYNTIVPPNELRH